MFRLAEAFVAGCIAMQESVKMGNPNILPLVVATNVSFATESYLKCLRVLELGVYIEGHDIERLFDALPTEVKEEIERRHARCEQTHPVFTVGAKSIDLPTDLRSLLSKGKNSFQDFRYAYENVEGETVWGLDILMLILKHLILEKRPDWTALQLFQTQSPDPDAHGSVGLAEDNA